MPYKPANMKVKRFTKGKGKKSYVAKHKQGKGASKLSVRKVQGVSGGLTETFLSKGTRKRMAKGLVALGAPSFHQITSAYNLASAAPQAPNSGLQSPVLLGQWNSVADIYNFAQYVPTTASIAGNTPTRFHLHSLRAVCTLNNSSSNTMFVDLYDIVAKKDIPTSVATGTPYSVSTPTNAWEQALVQQAVSTGTPLPYSGMQQLGALPTDGQLFNDYYKVIAKKSIVLPQNATHVHTIKLQLDKNYDRGELDIQSKYLAGYKGVSYYTLAIIRGQPCADSVTMATSTITPYMRWTVSEHYEYTWVQANGSQNTFMNSIPSSGVIEKMILLNSPAAGSNVGL